MATMMPYQTKRVTTSYPGTITNREEYYPLIALLPWKKLDIEFVSYINAIKAAESLRRATDKVLQTWVTLEECDPSRHDIRWGVYYRDAIIPTVEEIS